MDGNGRWAQERGLSRSEGHKAGVRAAKAIVTECRTLGIRHLTLYTFSQENWAAPRMKSACSSSCWSASLAKSSLHGAQRHQPARIR